MSTHHIEYKEQIVAFIDILGYSDLIEKTKNDEAKAIEIINHFKDCINQSVKGNLDLKWGTESLRLKSDIKYKIFSDCICISSDCITDCKTDTARLVFMFLVNLMYVQAELIMRNIFIRGGVSIDVHYHSDEIIFSAGLVKSYKLESKSAIYPRIIIDDSVIELLRSRDFEANYEILNSLIKRDTDGLAFLDYLSYIEVADEADYRRKYLSKHRGIVEKKLTSSSEAKVLGKYLWVARYHNGKVQEMFGDRKCEELLIDPMLLNYGSAVFKPVWYVFTFDSPKEGIEEGKLCVKAREKFAAHDMVKKYMENLKKDFRIDKEYRIFFEKEMSGDELREAVENEEIIIIEE